LAAFISTLRFVAAEREVDPNPPIKIDEEIIGFSLLILLMLLDLAGGFPFFQIQYWWALFVLYDLCLFYQAITAICVIICIFISFACKLI
jgi:hypothetical protein